jgi:hypothetical protein
MLQQIFFQGNIAVSLGAVAVLWIVLCVELFTSYFFASKLLKQFGLPSVTSFSATTQLIYHSLLPSLLYFSICGFVYITNVPGLSWLYFTVTFALFFLLLINIRAYYEDKYRLAESTHVVYDIAKMVIYFNTLLCFLTLADNFDFNFFVRVGLNFTIAALLTLLVLLRQRLTRNYTIPLILLSGLALGYLTTSIGLYLGVANIVTAFYSTLVFYIFNAILHHELNRDLRPALVLEYALVAAICLLVISLFT